ncbi:MAG: OmpA family protein [Lachnospiraceae bacterium]
MAKKKKQEDAPKGSPAWMATFSDLMNLLLCFFVLLFSMSSVDESKAEALIKSLADTFSIFSGGGSSFDDGSLISNGATQLTQLDDYFNTMGQTSDGDNENNPNTDENGNDSDDPYTPAPTGTPTPSIEETERQENKEQTGLIYEEVIGLADRYNIGEYLDVGVDAEYYRYIQIEISGAVLFDSGEAELKESAKPIISKLGDILKQYSGYKIEIIGHTDNVPQTNTKKFKNNRHLSAARALAVADYLIDEKGIDERMVEFTGKGETEPIADNSTEEGRAKNRRVEIRLYNLKNSEE